MKKQLMGMVIAGMIVVSASAMAEDDGHNNRLSGYSNMLEKEYSEVQIGEKSYELDFDLKNLDNFMLLEVEIEDSFLGKKHSDEEVKNKVEPIIEKVAAEVTTDFEKPVKAIVEYEDRNILIKKY